MKVLRAVLIVVLMAGCESESITQCGNQCRASGQTFRYSPKDGCTCVPLPAKVP